MIELSILYSISFRSHYHWLNKSLLLSCYIYYLVFFLRLKHIDKYLHSVVRSTSTREKQLDIVYNVYQNYRCLFLRLIDIRYIIWIQRFHCKNFTHEMKIYKNIKFYLIRTIYFSINYTLIKF